MLNLFVGLPSQTQKPGVKAIAQLDSIPRPLLGEPTVVLGKIITRTQRRHAFECVFHGLGLLAVISALVVLVTLLSNVVLSGWRAFQATEIGVEIHLDAAVITPNSNISDYNRLIRSALRQQFPEARTRLEQRQLYALLSIGSPYQLRDWVESYPELIGTRQLIWLLASDEVDQFHKGHLPCGTSFEARQQGVPCAIPSQERRLSDNAISWIDRLTTQQRLRTEFSWSLLTTGDSREPELAGLRNSLIGSLLTLLVTLSLAVPIGIATAIYLEELAPRNWLTHLFEININNLAAVPSIIFGLLGLAVLLNFFGLPRSAPLVGGIILALMTLPTVMIATRSALQAVPSSLREGALALGASRCQVIFDHVLPAALPGAMTGTIIGMAQALGETAPLLMIGMVAFIADAPGGLTDPATVLPVQIYLWADSPERAFTERTAGAIMVLLGFLALMNALAIYLRRRMERQQQARH